MSLIGLDRAWVRYAWGPSEVPAWFQLLPDPLRKHERTDQTADIASAGYRYL